MDEFLLFRSSLVKVGLNLLESWIVLHIAQSFLQISHILLDLPLLRLQWLQSLSAGVGVVIGLQYLFDLVEQLDSNALAMLPIAAFHLFEQSQFLSDLLDVLHVLVVNWLDVFEPALLLVDYYVVLRLQLLHLVRYLQLQSRMLSEVLKQLAQTLQVLHLKVKPRVHLPKVFVNFVTRLSLFWSPAPASLQFLQKPEPGLEGSELKVEPQLIETAVLGPVYLAVNELAQLSHLFRDSPVDIEQPTLQLPKLLQLLLLNRVNL